MLSLLPLPLLLLPLLLWPSYICQVRPRTVFFLFELCCHACPCAVPNHPWLCPTSVGVLRQSWPRQGRKPPTAGRKTTTRRVGHDFLELQCGKTNLGQLLLRALEEKSAIKPILDERFAEVAKGNTFQKTHHAIDIPIRHDAMGCLVAANDWQGR